MLRQIFNWLLGCILVVSFVAVSGCTDVGLSSNPPSNSQSSNSPVETVKTSPSASPTSPGSISIIPTPPAIETTLVKLPQLNGKATVELKLKNGIVTIEVDGTDAPVTAGNFVDLVKRGVYNNLTFHRVVKEPTPFVAQGGDPLGNGTGSFIDPVTSQPRYIPLEILPENEKTPVYGTELPSGNPPKLKHIKGAVAMARSQLPNSASSQFYITLADINFLDGSYAVFGYVTRGMDLVEQIQMGDRIESMTIVKGAENLKLPA